MKTNKKRIPHLKQLDQSNQQINPDNSVKKERGNTKEKTPNNSNQKEKSGKGNIPQMPSIKKGKYQKKTTTDISSINVQQQFEQPLEQASNALQQK